MGVIERLTTGALRALDEAVSPTREHALPPTGDFGLRPDGDDPPDLGEIDRSPAAVLVPIVRRREPTILLTRRTSELRAHAGQVAFPGGRCEPDDDTPIATAIRECQEEIGLDPRHVQPVGLLDDYQTVTGFLVTPFVSLVDPPFELVPDPGEVAEVFEIPLTQALDESNYRSRACVYRGRQRTFYVLEHPTQYIWGATAGMLLNLCRRMSR